MDLNGGGCEWRAVFAFLSPHVADYAAPLPPTTFASCVVFVGVNVRIIFPVQAMLFVRCAKRANEYTTYTHDAMRCVAGGA